MRPKRGKGRVWESRRQKRDRRRPKPFSAISLFGEFMDAKQSPTYVWKAMGLFSVIRIPKRKTVYYIQRLLLQQADGG